MLSLVSPHVLIRTFVIAPVFDSVFPWRFVAGSAAVGLGLGAYLSLQRGDLKRLKPILVYPIVGIVLTLQMPFAIARLADARWGTR